MTTPATHILGGRDIAHEGHRADNQTHLRYVCACGKTFAVKRAQGANFKIVALIARHGR